jgi:hypothetical protein
MTAVSIRRRPDNVFKLPKPLTPAQTAEWLAEDARAMRELEWPLYRAMQFSKLAFEKMNDCGSKDDGETRDFLTTEAYKAMTTLYELYHDRS